MEIILTVFSAVSAFSTTALAVLFFKAQARLNENTKKHTELILQQTQALGQQLSEILDAQNQSGDKVCEVLNNSSNTQIECIEKLLQQNHALEQKLSDIYQVLHKSGLMQGQKLSEILDAQNQSRDKVCEVLSNSSHAEIEHIEKIVNQNQGLEHKLSEIAQILQNIGKMQGQRLQALADKLTNLKDSLDESIKF